MRFLLLLLVSLCLMADGLHAQIRSISGQITNQDNQPIPGASIVVKDSRIGTTTNAEGRFNLNLPTGATVLRVSSIGYTSLDVPIGERSSLIITLTDDDKILNEVVVVGYGLQEKKDLTTSIAKVSGKDINQLPVSTPGEALAGLAAGVQVQSGRGGDPGQPPVIRIRGGGSLGAGNDPLFVVDGFPLQNAAQFNRMNPSDIDITDEAERREILAHFPVEDVWGVGRQHRKRLTLQGVHTALQLAQKPDWWVRGTFGTVTAERMVRELRGEACLEMLETGAIAKNICCSRSFGLNLASESHITEAVTTFAYRVGEKLREQGAAARVLTVFLHTNAFRADLPQYGSSVAIPLPVATADSAELVAYARAALRSLYKPHYLYKKAGVVATGISPVDGVTGGIFDAADRARAGKISAAMDALNRKYGRGTVRLAVQGTDKAFWHPKFERRTPRYTTQWRDLPKALME